MASEQTISGQVQGRCRGPYNIEVYNSHFMAITHATRIPVELNRSMYAKSPKKD